MAIAFEDGDTTVRFDGITFAKRPGLFTPRILKSMGLGRYEVAELRLATRSLRPGERVLDIGAGIGFLSTRLAQHDDVAAVLSVEANPALIDVIADTAARNGVADKAQCLHGILSGTPDQPEADFFIRKNFWASSLSGEGKAYVDQVKVPVHDLNTVIADFQPTLLICDIEGGEADLFAAMTPGTIDRIVVETHPGIYGAAGLAHVFRALLDRDFVLDIKAPRIGDVLTFEKVA